MTFHRRLGATIFASPRSTLSDPSAVHKLAYLTLGATLFLGAPLRAQNYAGTPIDSNVTILDLLIDPTVNEPYRIFMAKGIVYRASFSQPGVSIRMRSYDGKQLPFVVALTQLGDASGRSELEIYPQSDGEIEFRATFNDQSIPVRFRLWQDVNATARGRRSAAEGFWEIGLETFAAYYGPASVDGETSGSAGTSLGGCFSFRNGPGALGRLNGCAFGMEVFAGDGEALDRTRFYIEPRLRLFGGASDHHGWADEAGVLLSVGTMEAGTSIAPGIYAAHDYRGLSGNGLRVLFILRTDRMKGDIYKDPSQPELGTKEVSIWTPSLRFGAGYYW